MKHGIALVHGIGEQSSGDREEAIKTIMAEHSRLTEDFDVPDIVFSHVWYAPILSDRESDLLSKLDTAKIRPDRTRKFFVQFCGDLISYYQSKGGDDRVSVYDKIHDLFTQKMSQLSQDVGPDGKVSVISHSMGTLVARDWMKYFSAGIDVENLFFMGSPLAVAACAYPDYGDPGFAVPGICANFYDEDDPVGYPLRVLSDKWAGAVNEDVPVQAGGLLTCWNAMSHLGYWSDRSVIHEILRRIFKKEIGG